MKLYVYALLCIALAIPAIAKATDGSGGIQFYEMLFGGPDQRKESRNSESEGTTVEVEACGGYGGIIGGINGFFCHMEKDMGIVGPGAATKTFGAFKVHAEIVKTPTTVNSVVYDYVGSVWMCVIASADCTKVANFNRMYYIAFSYGKTTGVNKGYALNVPGIMNGNNSDAMEIIYDLGSATVNQTIKAKASFTQGLKTYTMRALGSKTTTNMQLNMSFYDGTNGFRFAMSGAPPSATATSNYYNMYYEAAGGSGSGGFYALDTAGLAAPATANGSCLVAVESGTSTTTSSGGSNCTSLSFGAFDYYAATASGPLSAQSLTSSSILGTWQGMAANPSAL